MSDVFNTPATPVVPFATPDTVTLEDLVGEGRKFATTELLVKSYAHGQNQIKSVETAAGELREELTARLTIEEAIKNATEARADPSNNGTPVEPDEPALGTPVTKEVTPESLTADDVTRMFAEREEQSKATTNRDEAVSKLNAITGSPENTIKLLQDKGAELGFSMDDLQTMAGKAPDAFFLLLGVDTSQNPPTGTLTTYVKPTVSGLPDPDRLEQQADFTALRRTDPQKYFSPAIQKKMLKVAMAAAGVE